MVARYILCILWGASLASLWWAVALFGSGKAGPNDAPVLLLFAFMASLGSFIAAAFVLITAAKEGT